MNKLKIIETRTAKTFLREDGIIHCEIIPGSEIELNDAIESVKAGYEVSSGIKRPVLVVFGKVKSLTREARAYFGGEETTRHTSAIALIVSSPVGRIIGNFMIGLNKTLYPTRLFNSEIDAVRWLKEFLD